MQALLESEHLLFWVLVCSEVLLGLQRRSVHSLRLCLCHRLKARNVGRAVVGDGLCALQLNTMFCGTVSACWLGVYTEGCQLSPCNIVYITVNLDSVSLTVVFW